MRSAIIVATIQLAFFSTATAAESQSQKTSNSPLSVTSAFTTTVRELSENGRVVSDNRDGWRLEKRFHTGNLLSVEDQLGTVVEVVRDARGRPIGLLLGRNLAVEYIYSEGDEPWQRKVFYHVSTRKILAEITNDEVSDAHWVYRSLQSRTGSSHPSSAVGPSAEQLEDFERGGHTVSSIEGHRYAMLPLEGHSPVIRSITIDGPPTWNSHDRVDYTDSEVAVYLSTGDPERTVIVTGPRHTDDDRLPVVIEGEEASASRYLAVLSTRLPSRSRATVEPSVNSSLSSSATVTLRQAFPIALEKVRNLPGCRSLFDAFVVSGNQRLTSTFYAPPGPAPRGTSCSTGALAFTHVGSPVTHLCSNFGTLSREEAAIVLIHEALHFAGLPEAPSTPGALTSRQINWLVQEACGF